MSPVGDLTGSLVDPRHAFGPWNRFGASRDADRQCRQPRWPGDDEGGRTMTTRRASRRVLALAVAGFAAALVLAACAAGPYPVTTEPVADLPGFWLGLWQGLITPITFVISLFTDDVNIYAVPNNGNWYDFGFVLGIMVAFGGPANQASAAGRPRRSIER
jgi:hypothetical protein